MGLGFLGLCWARSIWALYLNTIWAKFIFSVNNCPLIYNMAHGPCLYVLKPFICQKSFFSLVILILIMRPKVQLTPLDVDYQQKE